MGSIQNIESGREVARSLGPGLRQVPEDGCPATSDERTPFGLSTRELSVLSLLVEGLSDKEIAVYLGISRFTVNKHVSMILAKMDVRSRTAAAVGAVRLVALCLENPLEAVNSYRQLPSRSSVA